MNQLHIATVGISLLTNYARANNLPLENVLRRPKQLAEFIKDYLHETYKVPIVLPVCVVPF